MMPKPTAWAGGKTEKKMEPQMNADQRRWETLPGGVHGQRSTTRNLVWFYLLLSAFICGSGLGFAQVATGNIRGTVVDTSEAVIPNVTVSLTNVNTGWRRTVTTNDAGDFNAPSMPLGDYQITAELAGFQKKVISGINLQVDQTATIRIVLEPGAVSQSIEVNAAAPLLDSQTSSLGQVIENKRIIELPLNGRNPFAAIQRQLDDPLVLYHLPQGGGLRVQ